MLPPKMFGRRRKFADASVKILGSPKADHPLENEESYSGRICEVLLCFQWFVGRGERSYLKRLKIGTLCNE